MLDSQMMEKGMLAVDNIANGDFRKRGAVGFLVVRIAAPGPGRSVGGSDGIRTDDEIFVGIDCPARTNQLAPRALGRLAVRKDHVGPAGVAMQHEHHISLVRCKFTRSRESDLHGLQRATRLEDEVANLLVAQRHKYHGDADPARSAKLFRNEEHSQSSMDFEALVN